MCIAYFSLSSDKENDYCVSFSSFYVELQQEGLCHLSV